MKLVLGIVLVALAWLNVDAFIQQYERTPLGDAIDKATLKVLKEAYALGEDKNVITSPLGVLLLLSLYSAGAGEENPHIKEKWITATGRINWMPTKLSYICSEHFAEKFLITKKGYRYISPNVVPTKKIMSYQLSKSYSRLSNIFSQMNPSFLTLANKIYVDEQYELSNAFANTAISYDSEVEKLDFRNATKAAAIINQWAEEKTHGHIKKPASEDTFTSDTQTHAVAALFNVIFFQGHWHVPFDAKDTTDEDFHVDKSTTVKKPTMKLLRPLYYTESKELGAKMIELPYREVGFRMVVVRPNEIDGLPAVLEKASQKGLLEDVFNLRPLLADMDLEIPKFEIKSKLDLNKILPNVGISKIFSEPAKGIVKDGAVNVSKAFQEAFVKVDEEGATAGAFTGLVLLLESSDSTPPPPLAFKVDRPFLFTILHNDKVLFAGTYVH